MDFHFHDRTCGVWGACRVLRERVYGKNAVRRRVLFRQETVARFLARYRGDVFLRAVGLSEARGEKSALDCVAVADGFACARVRAGDREKQLRRDALDRRRRRHGATVRACEIRLRRIRFGVRIRKYGAYADFQGRIARFGRGRGDLLVDHYRT